MRTKVNSIFLMTVVLMILLLGNNVVFASYATGKCDKAVCNGAALNSSATLVSKSSTEHGYKATCSKCGAVYWGNVSSHRFGGWYKYSDSTHRRNCQNCEYKSATENHSGGTATCTEQAKCSKCYALYGAVDSNNHDYSVACSTCGTANVVCSRCGAVATHTCDTTPPTASDLTLSAIYTNTGIITATAQNASDNSSGINRVQWYLVSPDGATYVWSDQASDGQWYKNINVSSLAEGIYYVACIMYDNAGNASNSINMFGWKTFCYDKTLPNVNSITYDPGWKNTSITKDVTFSDALSGMQKIEYSYDNSTWYSDWASSTLSSDGKQLTVNRTWSGEQNSVLWFRAIDNAGNIYTYPGAYDLKIDTTAPYVNAITYDPGWKNTSITKDVTFSDALSGMQKIEYSYDNSTWYSDWASSTLSADGKQLTVNRTWSGEQNNVLWFRATDNAGNIYTYPGAYDLKIDTTAPTGSVTSYPQYTNSSTITIQVTASDNSGGSGMSFVTFPTWSNSNGQDDINWYRVDGSGPTYSITIDLKNHTPGTDGIYYVHVYAYDNAGNSNAIGYLTIYYDTTGPNHGYFLDGTPRYTNAADGTTFRVHAQGASDSLSGIDAMYLWVSTDGGANWNKISGQRMNEWDNNGTRAWYYDVTISGEGTYLCHTCPLDKAGNWTWGGPNEYVIVDRTAPTVYSITYDPGWKNTSIAKTVVFRDALAGIQKIEYSYDNSTWYSDWASSTLSADGKELTVNRTWSGEQNSVLWFRAIDNAGNVYTYPYSYDLKIDTTAPTGSIASPTGVTYTNNISYSLNVSVNASDTLSGVNRVVINAFYGSSYVSQCNSKNATYNSSTGKYELTYSLDEIQNTSTGATNNGEGTYKFDVYIYDNAGNGYYVGMIDVICDTTPPTGTVSIPKYTTTGQVTVTANATDTNGSGMLKIQYPTWSVVNGQDDLVWYETAGAGPNYTYTVDLTKHTPGTEGKYNIHVYAADNAYNNGLIGAQEVIYDKTAPTIGSADEVIYSSNSNITVHLYDTADNLSGIDNVYWWVYGTTGKIIDGEAGGNSGTTYYKEIDFSNYGEGWYVVNGVIEDKAGNEYDWTSKYEMNVCYDKTAPTSNLITDRLIYTKTGNVTVNLNATDALSGMQVVNFMIWSDTLGKEESIYSVIKTSETATYTVDINLKEKFAGTTGKFYVVPYLADNAGNTSWGTQTEIIYDTTAPTVEVSNITYGQNASIKLTDTLAGIKYFAVTTSTTAPTTEGTSDVTTGSTLNYWYQVAQTTNTTTVTFTGLGAGTYYVWGKDAAGNQAYKQFVVSKKSLTKPTLTGSYTYNGTTQTVSLTNFESSLMNISGNTRIDAGIQTVTISLKDTANYQWTDGTTTNTTLSWTIEKKQIKATIGETTLTYNGQAQAPTVTVETGITGEIATITVTGAKTNVGTYTATAEITSVTGGQGKASNYELVK